MLEMQLATLLSCLPPNLQYFAVFSPHPPEDGYFFLFELLNGLQVLEGDISVIRRLISLRVTRWGSKCIQMTEAPDPLYFHFKIAGSPPCISGKPYGKVRSFLHLPR